MKKIIELAQIFLSMCVRTWSYDKDTGRELAQALDKRIALESTPITEDWLKEHGWIESDNFQGSLKKDSCRYCVKYHVLITYHNSQEYVGMQRNEIWGIRTIADLLDAMELCGITMED